MSQRSIIPRESEIEEFEDWEFEENSPYCQCDLEPTEDEEASNTCDSCGKLLS